MKLQDWKSAHIVKNMMYCKSSDFFLDWWAEVTHFLKWWVQAYQTKHSWHLGSMVYLHTVRDTCMHICILTADYTVKTVLSGHSKKKTQLSLNAGQKYYRMLPGSIREHSAILLTFIKLPFVINLIWVCSFCKSIKRRFYEAVFIWRIRKSQFFVCLNFWINIHVAIGYRKRACHI